MGVKITVSSSLPTAEKHGILLYDERCGEVGRVGILAQDMQTRRLLPYGETEIVVEGLERCGGEVLILREMFVM